MFFKRRYNKLIGKVVVITGASSGIGEAIAHEFYKHGAQVVLCARRMQELERVKTDLEQTRSKNTTYTPIIIPLDLNETSELPNHVDKILSITGHIDILVNNGGISNRGWIKDTKLDVDKRIMEVNYFGSVALTKAVLPDMLKRKQGQIVYVSSISGIISVPERSAYCASKHALQAFADSLRAEVASENISVCVVSPGYVKTQISVNALTSTGEAHNKMDDTTASGYTPEYCAKEIVKAVVDRKKELIVGTLFAKIAIFLRKFLPSLYFYAIAKRAKKAAEAEGTSGV